MTVPAQSEVFFYTTKVNDPNNTMRLFLGDSQIGVEAARFDSCPIASPTPTPTPTSTEVPEVEPTAAPEPTVTPSPTPTSIPEALFAVRGELRGKNGGPLQRSLFTVLGDAGLTVRATHQDGREFTAAVERSGNRFTYELEVPRGKIVIDLISPTGEYRVSSAPSRLRLTVASRNYRSVNFSLRFVKELLTAQKRSALGGKQ
jgi:hypothetical protein